MPGKLPDYFERRSISTQLVEVHVSEWGAVKRGVKTEFRRLGKLQLPALDPPTPVVCYCQSVAGVQHRLMLLEEVWHEPLLAISPESLRREGFDSMDDFRVAWVRKTGHYFRPMAQVTCYRVRPVSEEELPWMGELLLKGLYGRLMDGAVESAVFS